MADRFTAAFLFLALASAQAAILRPPGQIIPGLLPSPIIPSLPPFVNVNPIVDVQAYSALSCGCGSPVSPCGCAVPSSTCGPTTIDCRVPTCTSLPPVTCGCGLPVGSCGCGAPVSPCGCGQSPCGCGVPTVAYSSYPGCGCGLTTPLLPPLPPVIGCTKYLRQVCVQPPFL